MSTWIKVLALRRYLTDGAALLVGNFLGIGILFLQGALLARYLGPAEFGVFAITTSAAALAASLVNFRTTDALTRTLVVDHETGRVERQRLVIVTSLACDFVTAIIAFISIIVLAPTLARATAGLETAHLFIIASGAVTLNFCANVMHAVARDRRHFILLGYYAPTARLVELAAMLLFISRDSLTIDAAVALSAVRSVVVGVPALVYLTWQWWFAYPSTGRILRDLNLVGRRRELQSFWRMMAASFIWSLVSALPKNADILILGLYRSPEESGYYRIAKNLVGVGQSVGTSMFSLVYRELLSMIAGTRWEEALNFVRTLTLALGGVAAVGGLVAGIFAPAIIAQLYGHDFIAATLPTRIMIVGGVASIALFWSQGLVLALGRIRYNTIVISVLSAAAAVLYVPGAYYAGMIGTALVSTAFWLSSQGFPAASGLAILRHRVEGREG